MGQKMPDEPIEFGRDCGAGFPVGETPKFLYARFSGIIKCPAGPLTPPNGWVFKCEQHAVDNCVWEATIGSFHMIIDMQNDPPNAILWLEIVPDGFIYFWDTNPAPIIEGQCYANNNLNCLLGEKAHSGVCSITWSTKASELLESINMEKSDNLFMEVFPKADGNTVYKFCRLRDATNVKILVTP